MLPFLIIDTARGRVVLASDATHYYANMDELRPFAIVFDLARMVEGWQRVRDLADSIDHVIPGHDPDVMRRYPSPFPDIPGVLARLDVPPQKR